MVYVVDFRLVWLQEFCQSGFGDILAAVDILSLTKIIIFLTICRDWDFFYGNFFN